MLVPTEVVTDKAAGPAILAPIVSCAVALVALAIEIVRGDPAGLISLPFCAAPIVLAFARVVPNAVRLGSRVDSASEQSALARAICWDHLICFGGILAFVGLQLLIT